MQPNVYGDPADIPVTALRAVGRARSDALASVGIRTIRDVLYHVPRRYLDRSTIVEMSDLHRYVGSTVTVIGRVTGIVPIQRGKKRLVVTLRDLHGSMDLVYFRGLQYWQHAFALDEALAVSGDVMMHGGRPNMIHPDIDRLQSEDEIRFINTGGIVPVYPSSAELEKVGLNRHGGFRRIMHEAVDRFAPSMLDPYEGTDLRERRSLAALPAAIEQVHRPPSLDALEDARRRLIYDEFFLLSLQLAITKHRNAAEVDGIPFAPASPTARRLVSSLPFALTGAQKRALREIVTDMQRPHPMNRLLQGDVGSGKTVVALLAMLVAIDNGYQCAMMVPTEILAEQHSRTITRLLDDLALPVRLLTGQQSAKDRARIIAEIANGDVAIAVGTHALIQDDVTFHRLGMVVIDEQHRFGVMQRGDLRRKGERADVLVMTATPIPRTLSMTLYGDLDVSVIDELPAGRRNIRTAIRTEQDRPGVWEFVRSELASGSQAYVVFPLVSESERLDLRAATQEYEALARDIFPQARVGLLHGRLPAQEKEETMRRFTRGEIDLLVATTVVEVGVDVPNATVMIIEHADRFGLAQLHQLRGRVGRGRKQGTCILMTDHAVLMATGSSRRTRLDGSDARRRLETMRDTLDGFRIAEVDMQIRGPGDLWGTQQSGFPVLHIANLLEHEAILREAREDAFRMVADDPHLRRAEHASLRAALGAALRSRLAVAGIA